jgi:uncharacterized caspase-like protein
MADVAALAAALADRDIAGFDSVTRLEEPSRDAAFGAVDELFADRNRDDLVLLYFSGHGIRDDWGRLFFALGGTRHDRPRATGLPASELKHFMDDSRSRRQILVLDCCHAGAFMESHRAAATAPALTEDTFEVRGYGREILAATNATAYAFEGERVEGDGTSRQLGRFTGLLVEGLRTGAGVTDRDEITVGDLFEYARLRLMDEEPRMRPQYWRERSEAPLVIARNPRARARLPEDLLAALDDKGDWLRRRGAIDWLGDLIEGDNLRLRSTALAELKRRERNEEHRFVHQRILVVLKKVEATVSEIPAVAAPAIIHQPTATLHALAVGVNHYERYPHLALRYAAADAEGLCSILELQEGGLYKRVQVLPLVNEDATWDGIIDGFESLKRDMTPEDVAVVLLSGHGMNDAEGVFHFLPHDANIAKPIHLRRSCVGHDYLKDTLRTLADRGKTLLFLDACHSGGLIPGTKAVPPDIGAIANDLAQAENGVIVFASCTSGQVSFELPEWENGAMTEALLEALAGKARRDGNRLLVSDIANYVKRRVKELTDGQQTPVVLWHESRFTDPPVYLLR